MKQSLKSILPFICYMIPIFFLIYFHLNLKSAEDYRENYAYKVKEYGNYVKTIDPNIDTSKFIYFEFDNSWSEKLKILMYRKKDQYFFHKYRWNIGRHIRKKTEENSIHPISKEIFEIYFSKIMNINSFPFESSNIHGNWFTFYAKVGNNFKMLRWQLSEDSISNYYYKLDKKFKQFHKGKKDALITISDICKDVNYLRSSNVPEFIIVYNLEGKYQKCYAFIKNLDFNFKSIEITFDNKRIPMVDYYMWELNLPLADTLDLKNRIKCKMIYHNRDSLILSPKFEKAEKVDM